MILFIIYVFVIFCVSLTTLLQIMPLHKQPSCYPSIKRSNQKSIILVSIFGKSQKIGEKFYYRSEIAIIMNCLLKEAINRSFCLIKFIIKYCINFHTLPSQLDSQFYHWVLVQNLVQNSIAKQEGISDHGLLLSRPCPSTFGSKRCGKSVK